MDLGQRQRVGPQQGAQRHGRGVLQLSPARPRLEGVLAQLFHRAAHTLLQGTFWTWSNSAIVIILCYKNITEVCGCM